MTLDMTRQVIRNSLHLAEAVTGFMHLSGYLQQREHL